MRYQSLFHIADRQKNDGFWFDHDSCWWNTNFLS